MSSVPVEVLIEGKKKLTDDFFLSISKITELSVYLLSSPRWTQMKSSESAQATSFKQNCVKVLCDFL